MKVQIELNFPDDRQFLNFWNYRDGDDVVCQIRGGKLFLQEEETEREISFIDFVKMVKDRQ